ncbi:MAG: DNA-3-methyladenine glycosylase [Candidatus Paceibacteria bacterium]
MNKILGQEYFEQSTKKVARDLLGKYLVKKQKGENQKVMITETEAYLGEKDKACHAYSGKTDRTKVMFGPPGRWYVYLIYGIYDMLNIVTENEDSGCAVLIRAAGDYDGPGILTREMDIDKGYNNKSATKETGLWIEQGDKNIKNNQVKTTSRIGVEYAEEWADKPLRFKLKEQ